jgi:RND superfamily putative drug exporter
MTNLPVRVARWSAHHPWRAIAGWILFVAVCLGSGIAVGNNPAVTDDYRVGEAGEAEAMAEEGGLPRQPVEHILITAPEGAELDRDAAAAAASDLAERMAALPVVAEVSEPIASQDGDTLRVDVVLDIEEREAAGVVDDLIAQTEAVQSAHPDVVLDEVGRPSISQAVADQRGQDLLRIELFTLPVTLIVLLLVFRSLSLALVPIMLALSSIAAAIGLSMLASHAFPDAGVGMNVIILIGMAVGVDYTLFYLKREREERARADGRLSPTAVVDLAAATSGRVVIASGIAVAVSSASLYLVDDVIFSSLATGAILVTLAAVVSSVTVLPATLAKLAAFAERRAARRHRPVRTPRDNRAAAAVMRAVDRHPARTLMLATLAMLALAAPMLGLNPTDLGPETHSRELSVMRDYDRLTAEYPELKSVHQVVVRGDDPRLAGALAELEALALDDPNITGPTQLRTSEDGNTHVLTLSLPYFVGEAQAQDSLQRLREAYAPAALADVDSVEYAVTGDTARYVDYPQHQQERLPVVIGALLFLTLLITAWVFRSVVLGLIGVFLNLLSAAAAIGVLTWVFQGRWAEGLLDFNSTGSVGSRVPLFLFVILFGLSMDYQFFLISRIREAVLDGVPTRQAVFDGMRQSAPVITSAAVVMVTVFAAFLGVHLIEMKQTGFVLAVAVLLDAFVIRTLIVPSLLLLLGDRVWWPSRAKRLRTAAPLESVR